MTGFLIYFVLACYFSGWAGWWAAEWENTPKGKRKRPIVLFAVNVAVALIEVGVALSYAWEATPR